MVQAGARAVSAATRHGLYAPAASAAWDWAEEVHTRIRAGMASLEVSAVPWTMIVMMRAQLPARQGGSRSFACLFYVWFSSRVEDSSSRPSKRHWRHANESTRSPRPAGASGSVALSRWGRLLPTSASQRLLANCPQLSGGCRDQSARRLVLWSGLSRFHRCSAVPRAVALWYLPPAWSDGCLTKA